MKENAKRRVLREANLLSADQVRYDFCRLRFEFVTKPSLGDLDFVRIIYSIAAGQLLIPATPCFRNTSRALVSASASVMTGLRS